MLAPPVADDKFFEDLESGYTAALDLADGLHKAAPLGIPPSHPAPPDGVAVVDAPEDTDPGVSSQPGQPGAAFCNLCRRWFNSQAQYEEHVSGRKHGKLAAAFRREGAAGSDSSRLPMGRRGVTPPPTSPPTGLAIRAVDATTGRVPVPRYSCGFREGHYRWHWDGSNGWWWVWSYKAHSWAIKDGESWWVWRSHGWRQVASRPQDF